MKKIAIVLSSAAFLLFCVVLINNFLFVKKVPQSDLSSNLDTPKLIQSPNSSTQSKLSVQRITAANASALIKTGPDAIGGIGDWLLTNGTICAVITDVPHENEFSSLGGALTDLGFCDRKDDHFTTMQDILDADRKRPVDIMRIETESDASSVSIITYAQRDAVAVKTRYRQDDVACHLSPMSDGEYLVMFDEAQSSVTPGQSVVFYQGNICLGGGIINSLIR